MSFFLRASRIAVPASARTYATTVVVPGILQAPAITSDKAQLAFHVPRTASQSLPVYYMTDRASNAKTTIIRKVKGDASSLKQALLDDNILPSEIDIKVNPVTNHVHIKGQHMEAVKNWLFAKGF